MTLQLTLSEASLLGTSGSAFLALGNCGNALVGLTLTPTVIFNRLDVGSPAIVQGAPASDRAARLAAIPKRAAALSEGRKRLASAVARRNDGLVTLAGLRLAAGLSQAQLAERIGMLQPNVARMERRPGDLAMSTLASLAGAFGTSADAVIAAAKNSNQLAESRVE